MGCSASRNGDATLKIIFSREEGIELITGYKGVATKTEDIKACFLSATHDTKVGASLVKTLASITQTGGYTEGGVTTSQTSKKFSIECYLGAATKFSILGSSSYSLAVYDAGAGFVTVLWCLYALIALIF